MVTSSSGSGNKKERPPKSTKYTKETKLKESVKICSICDELYERLIACDDCSQEFCIKCWQKNIETNPSKPCLAPNCSFHVDKMFLVRNKFSSGFVKIRTDKEMDRKMLIERKMLEKMGEKKTNRTVSSSSKFETLIGLRLECPRCPSQSIMSPCVFFTDVLETTVCRNEICKNCFQIKDRQEKHQCKNEDIEHATGICKDTTQCPQCDTLIQKISGCNSMKCHVCLTNFDFKTGEIQQTSFDQDRDRDLSKWKSHHESSDNDLLNFVLSSVNEEMSSQTLITMAKNQEVVSKLLYEDDVMETLINKASKIGIVKEDLIKLKNVLQTAVSELLNKRVSGINKPFVGSIVRGLYRILFINDVHCILDAEKIVYFIMSCYDEEFQGMHISDSLYKILVCKVQNVLSQIFQSSKVKPKNLNASWIDNGKTGKNKKSRTTMNNVKSRVSSKDDMDIELGHTSASSSATSSSTTTTTTSSNTGSMEIIRVNRLIQDGLRESFTDGLRRLRYRSNPQNLPRFMLGERGETLRFDMLDRLKNKFISTSYFFDKNVNMIYYSYGKLIFVMDLHLNMFVNVCKFDDQSSNSRYEILNAKKDHGRYTILLRFADDDYKSIRRVIFEYQSFLVNDQQLVLKEFRNEVLLSHIHTIVKCDARKDHVMFVIDANIYDCTWGSLFDGHNFSIERYGKYLYSLPSAVENEIKTLKSVNMGRDNFFVFEFDNHCQILQYKTDVKMWDPIKNIIPEEKTQMLKVTLSPTGKYLIMIRRRFHSQSNITHEIMDMESYEIVSEIQFVHTTRSEFPMGYTDIFFEDDTVYVHYVSSIHSNFKPKKNAKKYVRVDFKDFKNSKKQYDTLSFYKNGKEHEASQYALFFPLGGCIIDIEVNDFKVNAIGVPFMAKFTPKIIQTFSNIAQNIEYLNSNWGGKMLDINSINASLRSTYNRKVIEEKIPLESIMSKFLSDCKRNFIKHEINVRKNKLFMKVKSKLVEILSRYKNRLIVDGLTCLQKIKIIEDYTNRELKEMNQVYNNRFTKTQCVDFLALNVQSIYCSANYLKTDRKNILSICW